MELFHTDPGGLGNLIEGEKLGDNGKNKSSKLKEGQHVTRTRVPKQVSDRGGAEVRIRARH